MRRLVQLVRFVRVALAAREVQDYLWGGAPGFRTGYPETWDNYIAALQKRIDRLHVIEQVNGSWRVEARKRLLQTAAVAVAMMEYIDNGGSRG